MAWRRLTYRKGESVSISGQTLDAGLYLVATPIGNLRDITLRALDILKAADAIACEDTRVTGRLLSHYGIERPLIAYHAHNAASRRPALLARLGAGERIALVSDAGTPVLSDPGRKLVDEAQADGLSVFAAPGPSSLTAALSVAGLACERVLFLGFLPAKSAARRREIAAVAGIDASLVLFEAPHRLAASLADLAAGLGPREAALCRELTKRFEEVRRGALPELAAEIARQPVKGEIVLVIAPPSPDKAETPESEIDAALRDALGSLSVKEAATAVAWITGEPRRKLYQRALRIKEEG